MKALLYDALMWPTEMALLRKARRRLLSKVSGNVLEVGVGTGLTFPRYPQIQQLVGIEPDPRLLARADTRRRSLGLPITLLRADGQALPFADATFDAVVAHLVLCTVPDPLQALVEMRRVLKPHGHLFLLEHVRGPGPLFALGQDVITPLWKLLASGCHPNRDTLRTVQEAGFRVDEVIPHFMGLGKLLEIVAAAQ